MHPSRKTVARAKAADPSQSLRFGWGVLLALALLAFAAATALPAKAHHGWAWTTGGNIEVSGRITAAELGLPHGVLTLQVNQEVWTIEVGQPWRNERAGLKDGDLAPGTEIKVLGQPSADIEDKLVKAERLWIKGTLYDLYPNRD
ncbi:MAG: DUF6152 family protein [Rhodospirillaceae bacterium]